MNPQFIDTLPPNSVEFQKGYFVSPDGSVYSARHKRLIRLRPRPNGKGYLQVTIHGHEQYIHRIVGTAFLENPNGCPQINHKDGNKENNAASNLEWVDQSQNLKHAFALGLITREHMAAIGRLGGIRKAEKRRNYGT